MIQQIAFKDLANNVFHGGIMLENGDIVCGCCGKTLKANEKDIMWELIDTYDSWEDLDETICGDMIEEYEDDEDV